MTTPLLRLRGIDKTFVGNQVLHGIDLDIEAGSVHALVGENGAGKSTLMKILAGVHTSDGGTIELDGAATTFRHPLDAQRAGIATVFQEFNLLPDRTVAENIHLGREPRRYGFVDRAAMRARTGELLADLGVTGIHPNTFVRDLSVAQQQVVEIAKAVSLNARIVSMDEPTAALAEHEVALLYRLIERLRDRGLTILYVSHRLKEIFDLCDTVTVLKDGRLVSTAGIEDTDADGLVRSMVGRTLDTLFGEPTPVDEDAPVRLAIRGGGNDQLDGIDLTVRRGEIVGLAGLQGSGRTEIAHALFGIAPFRRGTITIDDRPVSATSPRKAIRAGVALVSEDRKAEGLALHQSISANARLVLDAVTPRRSRHALGGITETLAQLHLVSRGPDQAVRLLSGGNQQKVVLAKWLATQPVVMILDEPTRGIDIGAKHTVYQLIRDIAATGVAIVLITSELPELLGLADRLVVMRDGRVAANMSSDSTEEEVMAAATGHTGPDPEEEQ
ncbi:sugar ABC transporter ATP-binding protein [Stackebrandtia soli]|uniref:sugar ABC transporter ATP-binding protein n=1 Tax=Stackebrandtia soli TaxID=1892856 RepID=UPI0039E79A1E